MIIGFLIVLECSKRLGIGSASEMGHNHDEFMKRHILVSKQADAYFIHSFQSRTSLQFGQKSEKALPLYMSLFQSSLICRSLPEQGQLYSTHMDAHTVPDSSA
jgi:hypothetical protein